VWSADDEEPADVAEVPDAQALWRLLVSGAGRRELAPRLAIDTFRRLHDGGQPQPFDSALLLCTDWRWQRTSARVLAGIVESGILDDAEQDRLAEKLLRSDMVTYVHPLGWISSTFIEFDLDAPHERREVHVDPSTPVSTERHVWPPLRSWAAKRLLVRNRAAAADVLRRARALPAHDGAAVVTGAVRAANDLDSDQAPMVVEAALRWGQKAPRKAALELLVAWGEPDRAQALAADDPDASIRAWGRKTHTDVANQDGLFD
jgi:hypothetical protein